MIAASTALRSQIDAVPPPRILVAVHGHEPADWTQETCRVLSTWAGAPLRVLALLDVPSPPFTSLTPLARRAYAGARMQWREIERQRLVGPVEGLVAGLPGDVDITWAPAMRGDLAATILVHARAWPADVVVIGAPARGRWSWLTPGPVHTRLLRLAPCTLVVVTPPPAATGRSRRPVPVRPALATGGGA